MQYAICTPFSLQTLLTYIIIPLTYIFMNKISKNRDCINYFESCLEQILWRTEYAIIQQNLNLHLEFFPMDM